MFPNPFMLDGGIIVGFPLDIQGGQIGTGTHTDIPVYINQTNFPNSAKTLNSALSPLNGGGDLRIHLTDPFGTRLSLEVVKCVLDANPANSLIELHVKVPSLVNGVTTRIWVMYKIPGQTSQPAVGSAFGRNDVWSNGFRGVYHLDQAVTGTATQANLWIDSTGRNANADKVSNYGGTGHVLTNTNSKMGVGQTFDQFAYADLKNGADLRITGANLSLSCWAYPIRDGWPGGTRFISKRASAPGSDNYALIQEDTANGNRLTCRINNQFANTGLVMVNNQWNHCFGTFNGTTINTYRNAGIGTSHALAANVLDSTIQVCLGSRFDEARWFDDGTLDECRIAAATRNQGWITTEYNNQNAPTSFILTGTVQIF